MVTLSARFGLVTSSRVWGVAHGLALVGLVVAVTCHVDLAQPVADPFQEAEYAVLGPLARADPGLAMPVLIHGGLDVAPSMLAAAACRADAQLVCVRSLNMLLQLVAGMLLVGLLAMLSGLGSPAAVLAGVPTVALLWLYGGATTRIADAHQAAPGIRDLCVLAALVVMGRLAGRLDRRGVVGGRFEVLVLGVLAAASVFWAYNRGLVVIAVVGVFILLLCAWRRSAHPGLLAGIGALGGAAVIAAWAGPGLFRHTLSDIQYWRENSALWHAPLHPPTLVAALVVHLLGAALALPPAWSAWRAGRPGRALMTLALLATAGLYWAQSVNRADLLHVRWTLWPATLLLGLGIAAGLESMAVPRRAGVILTVTLLAGLCLEGLTDTSIGGAIRYGLGRNARLLWDAAPSDRDLAGPDLVRVANLVRTSGRCTFAANNAGLVHLLSGQPPCSRFMFGAYVAPDRQQSVIAELEAARPEIILWDAANWWAHVDRRPFRTRAPLLADWLLAQFPVETRLGGYVLRSRHEITPSSLATSER